MAYLTGIRLKITMVLVLWRRLAYLQCRASFDEIYNLLKMVLVVLNKTNLVQACQVNTSKQSYLWETQVVSHEV